MDFNELKENAEQICKELKDKAPADLSALALSLSAIIKMMIPWSLDLWNKMKSKLLPIQTYWEQ